MNYFTKLSSFLLKRGVPVLPRASSGCGPRAGGAASRAGRWGADGRLGQRGPCSRSALVQVAGIQQRRRWTQAPARQEGTLGGQADEAISHGGGEEAGGKVLKRFILMCCGGRVILQEAACIKISRPVDWSVTVICGSSPEVMGSNWARRRRPDRLPSRTGGGLAAGKIY